MPEGRKSFSHFWSENLTKAQGEEAGMINF